MSADVLEVTRAEAARTLEQMRKEQPKVERSLRESPASLPPSAPEPVALVSTRPPAPAPTASAPVPGWSPRGGWDHETTALDAGCNKADGTFQLTLRAKGFAGKNAASLVKARVQELLDRLSRKIMTALANTSEHKRWRELLPRYQSARRAAEKAEARVKQASAHKASLSDLSPPPDDLGAQLVEAQRALAEAEAVRQAAEEQQAALTPLLESAVYQIELVAKTTVSEVWSAFRRVEDEALVAKYQAFLDRNADELTEMAIARQAAALIKSPYAGPFARKAVES